MTRPDAFHPHPAVLCLPLETRTLPPATHTGCYLVGDEAFCVIDPAAPGADEQRRLQTEVDARLRAGRRLACILVTHGHPDHVGGVRALHEATGAPVRGHPRLVERRPDLPLDAPFGDEEEILLGEIRLIALHTPGHAYDHLIFFEPARSLAFTGDLVPGVGTVVIDPPDGDMALYLHSLERLAALDPALILPGHGPVLQGKEPVLRLHAHRLERERKVLEAVLLGRDTLETITAAAYTDVPVFLHGLAARSALAHLLKLLAEGRIREAGDRFLCGRAD